MTDKRTLYDDYDPQNSQVQPIDRLYRSSTGPFPERVVLCSGIFQARNKEGGSLDKWGLWITDLKTTEMKCIPTTREELRSYIAVSSENLDSAERGAIDRRAKMYAQMCQRFSQLCQDPDAGKGPEHFGRENRGI